MLFLLFGGFNRIFEPGYVLAALIPLIDSYSIATALVYPSVILIHNKRGNES